MLLSLLPLLSYGLPIALAGLVLTLVVGPVISYLWDQKKLRSFPSPSFAGFTSLWRMWHNVHNNHYLVVHNAHKELGTHVRIGPNHLSVVAPQAAYDIYGHGANMMKEGFYDAAASAHRNLADARDKYEHQAKRKMLAHAFAQKTIVGLEPVLVDMLNTFVSAVDAHVASGESMNFRLYFNYFTIDLLGMILFSKRMGCVPRGDDTVDAETPEGVVYKTSFLKSLLNAIVLNTALGMAANYLPITKKLFKKHSYTQDAVNFENIIYHHVKERLEKGTSLNDIFTRLLQDSKGTPLNLPMGELVAECTTMMNAGTETTTAAMTNTIYYVYTHPEVLAKLRAELDPMFANGMPSYETVSGATYLRTCTEESLRVRPPAAMGLPRIVPEGGRVIAGQFVAGGVTVSVPTYSLLRDESVFERASEYMPERWLTDDSEKKREMMKVHLPFSTGPRACIGRNIAYFEQTLVIATLVHHFDLEVPAGFKLPIEERFNSNPGNLFVKCKRREI
jgi:cytochrome P450